VFRVHIPSILHVAVVGAASLLPFLSECSSGVWLISFYNCCWFELDIRSRAIMQWIEADKTCNNGIEGFESLLCAELFLFNHDQEAWCTHLFTDVIIYISFQYLKRFSFMSAWHVSCQNQSFSFPRYFDTNGILQKFTKAKLIFMVLSWHPPSFWMMKTSNPIKKLKDFDFLLRCLLVCYKTYYDQLFFCDKILPNGETKNRLATCKWQKKWKKYKTSSKARVSKW